MPEFETFPKAPITEALIDVRVVMEDDFAVENLKPLIEELSGEFPINEDRIEQTHKIEVKEDGEIARPQSESRHLGSILYPEDRLSAVQVRINGFTFSKMKPYQDWDQLRDNARRLWERYREVVRPKSVVRIASRFINRIELPTGADFDDYFTTGVRLADGIPQELTKLFFRAEIPNREHQFQAIVTMTLGRVEPGSDTFPFLFDIDVFKEVDLDPSDNEIWATFENIRLFKDQIFHQSITEQAKELFR